MIIAGLKTWGNVMSQIDIFHGNEPQRRKFYAEIRDTCGPLATWKKQRLPGHERNQAYFDLLDRWAVTLHCTAVELRACVDAVIAMTNHK